MSLLHSDWLAELEALGKLLRSGRAHSGWARALSRSLGTGAEFADRRAYAAGDDLDSLDWHAYARSARPVVKRFRAERTARAWIVLDGSASLSLGQPLKFECAKLLAAAVCYLCVSAGCKVEVLLAGGKASGKVNAGLRALGSALGRGQLPRLLRALEQCEPAGSSDVHLALRQVTADAAHAGVCVVLSDFLAAGDWGRALRGARARQFELALVQILAADELEPGLAGDRTLVDIETGQSLALTLDEATLLRYQHALQTHCQQLAGEAKRQGHSYVRLASAAPLKPVLRRLVLGDIDV